MGKTTSLIAAAIAVCGFLAGCAPPWLGKWRPSPLHPVERPDPVEDFVRLRQLFKDHDGQLVSREDTVVKWKDTYMFRMFEFKYHTVVIFPYQWTRKGLLTSEGFNLIMFAGHVREYDNLFASVLSQHDSFLNSYSDMIRYDLSPAALQDVGFEDFHLGELKSDVVEKHKSAISVNSSGPGDPDQVSFVSGGFISERREGIFYAYFGDGRLVYLNFWVPKFPTLGAYAIDRPVTPVLEEGEFPVPEEEKEDQ